VHVAKQRIEAEHAQHFELRVSALELAVGIEGEAARSRVEYHPPARKMLVFVPGDSGRKAAADQACGAELTPALLYLVVSACMGEEIAVWFSLDERCTVDDQLRRSIAVAHVPHYAHGG
jgi:hypothetical protein